MARTASSNSTKPRKSKDNGSTHEGETKVQPELDLEPEPLWKKILLAIPRAFGSGVRAVTGVGEYDPAYRRDGLCFLLLVLAVLFCASEWFRVSGPFGQLLHAIAAGVLGLMSVVLPVLLAAVAFRLMRNSGKGSNNPRVVTGWVLLMWSICSIIDVAIAADHTGFDITILQSAGGLFGFFQKKRNELEALKASYAKAEANVDKIAQNLENHQITLLKDVAMFDQMYELNLKYYKELTMYILAGKKRLAAVRAGELEELRKQAEASGAQEDAQAYNDYANLCARFEKKLHDLELTRMISIQMGPQTRLLQNNDTLMVEKIQSSLVNTIPLWKSQMVLALGMEHSRQATAAQSAVTEMTNELLKKNADMLKTGTIATAKEAERSIVDIETLKHTNEQLISTLDEVLNIQRDGAAKRKAAEVELGKIEGELKQKLMELHN